MTSSGYPLEAFLLIDNNAVVSLCEFYCDAHRYRPFTEMISAVCDEVTEVFNKLRRFAVGKTIYTTAGVRDEFKPERGVLASYPGFNRSHCDCLKDHIHQEITALDVNLGAVRTLRAMREAPKRFGSNLERLSEQDLSLVILALGLAAKYRQRVYILTDEEDLRAFVSWMRTKPEAKALCNCSELIEALHSFIYIDSAHRSCAFSTQQVYQFLTFLSMRQLERQNLAGTAKGDMISQTYKKLYEAIKESSAIKLQNAQKGAAA